MKVQFGTKDGEDAGAPMGRPAPGPFRGGLRKGSESRKGSTLL